MLAGQIINGIVSGAMYALVAIGFSLVIGVLDKLNFAHPEVFMFGGFVALALWLPRYLIGAYGMDVATAGMIAAAYSIPASLFRVVGGWLSDRWGARKVMYWTFGVSVICTFLLSYPDTTYTIRGIKGDAMNLVGTLVLYGLIAAIHIWLGHNPFMGTYG